MTGKLIQFQKVVFAALESCNFTWERSNPTRLQVPAAATIDSAE